jgi:hypothetical protein
MKDDFLEQEERERLNPSNVLLRILMIHTFNFNAEEEGSNGGNEPGRIDRKLYSFFVNKNSNMLDIKDKVRKDFGFD